MGHIPPSCHSSDATDMSHKGSQNQQRHTGSAAFPRGLPNNECLHETAMTGVSWNACDLKIMNSNLKSSGNTLHRSHGWQTAHVFTSRLSTFELHGLESVHLLLSSVYFQGRLVSDRNEHLRPLREKEYSQFWPDQSLREISWHCMTFPLHGAKSQGTRVSYVPYESAHWDDNVTGLPDPAFCRCTAICMYFQFFLWARQSENDTRYDERVGVWDRTHLSLPSVPQRHRPQTGPGRAKSSRTWSADTPGLGWRNAGCSN